MEVARPNTATFTTGTGLVAAALILIGTWSPQAFSASWSKSDCPEASDEIQPEMTLDDLALDPVDHPVIDPTSREIDEIDAAGAASEQVTPFLYLAPRVASVLKDVFGEDRDQAEMEESASSPLAERDEVTRFPSSVDSELPEGSDLEGSSLPLLQRQMYRIDI